MHITATTFLKKISNMTFVLDHTALGYHKYKKTMWQNRQTAQKLNSI